MSGVALELGDRGIGSYALAFAVTQLIEVPLYAAALRDCERERSLPLRSAIGFGASALTHPIVWYVMPAIAVAVLGLLARWGVELGATGGLLVYGALAEGFAVGAEALYLKAFGVKWALLWSLAANAASVAGGAVLVWTMG